MTVIEKKSAPHAWGRGWTRDLRERPLGGRDEAAVGDTNAPLMPASCCTNPYIAADTSNQ